MNRIVQSEDADSKETRVKSGRINFPARRGERRILFVGMKQVYASL
jgi:hypothetical protein